MSNPAELNRGLGQAEGRIGALERNITEINESLKAQSERLGHIERLLSEAKGSWRMLVAVAGIAGMMGALAVKILPFISWGR